MDATTRIPASGRGLRRLLTGQQVARRTAVTMAAAMTLAMAIALAAGPASAEADASDGPAADGLEEVGQGEYSWFGLRVYHASFATETGRFSDWTDTERARFEIYYHRDVSASKLIDIAREEWDRLGVDAPPRWFGWLRQLLPDVRAGDTLSCLVLPDERTVFYHNGEETGEVAEPAFGPAFLSIWLHPEARAAELRRALLGESGRS